MRVLWRADRRLAIAWWVVLAFRGLLPAALAVVTGVLVGAVQAGDPLAAPLAFMGVVLVLFQVLSPLHLGIGQNLGDRAAAWLYDTLTEATLAPPGMGHLEAPELAADFVVAREFDLGMTGPPLSVSMDFIASGLWGMLAGVTTVAVLFGFAWWPPLLLGVAWGSTHWLLRESGVWKDRNTDEVRAAQRDSEYAYRMAVDPPAAKELRLFGLADWTVARFIEKRRRLHELQYAATRLRERPLLWSLLIVGGANAVVFWALADAALSRELDLGPAVVYVQAALSAGAIAFGGLNWALDGASAPAAAVLRLGGRMAAAGALPDGKRPADGLPAKSIRFRDLSFRYPSAPDDAPPVFDGFDLEIPAGSSLAIVGRNGAGKTTLAKLLCRLYDPDEGAIEIDGVDLRDLDLAAWRQRVAAVFQDFIRYELPLRENVAPRGASDEVILDALQAAGARDLASLDTILAKGYDGGTDLSGGQWQRVALARALAGVRTGAGVVLLDEPTAQLDVRGEAEIFERILSATRGVTTILVSHRFSTVRHADRICVLEHGRVIELGTHEELMELGGRYETMFSMQAERFTDDVAEEEGVELERLD